MCTMKDGEIQELFSNVFRKSSFPATLLNSTLFMQLVLENSLAKAQMRYGISVPTRFGAQLIVHEMTLESGEIERK